MKRVGNRRWRRPYNVRGCPSQVAPRRLVRSRAVRFRSVRHTACSDCRSSLHVPAGDRTTMDTGCFNASPTIPSHTRSTRTTILSITSISRPPAVTVTRVSERISLISWFATPHVLREKPEGTRGTRPSVPPPRADGHGSSRGTHPYTRLQEHRTTADVQSPYVGHHKHRREASVHEPRVRWVLEPEHSIQLNPFERHPPKQRKGEPDDSREEAACPQNRNGHGRPLALRFFGVSAGLASARSGAGGADRFRDRGLTRPKSQNSRQRTFSLSVRSASMNRTSGTASIATIRAISAANTATSASIRATRPRPISRRACP